MVQLAEMRTTLRRMTARYTQAQMPDAQIDRYINLAYTLHFPEQFRNLKLNKPYVFLTTPNVDTYDFIYQNGLVVNPAGTAGTNDEFLPGNIQLMPPVYCQGYLLRYYQDKSTFYNRWPKLSVNQIISMGKGIVGTYTGIIPSTPFYRAQVDIFGNVTEAAVIISAFDNTGFTYTLSDVPNSGSNIGNLVEVNGTVVGTVNYFTGAYSFLPSASAIIPTTATIYAAVSIYQASRPTDVLFYNQQMVLRPCPMQVYQMEFQISQQPTELIADTDAPELDEWYLFICAIAAKLIYTDFPDPEGMSYLMPIYQDQLQMAQRRSLRQMNSQRAQTIFSVPTRPLAGYFFGTEYSGN